MQKLIVDTALAEQMRAARHMMEVVDASGRFLGYFDPFPETPKGVKSPFSREQIEQFRKEPGGRSLAEILRDLEREHGPS